MKFTVSLFLCTDREFMVSCLKVWAIDLDLTYSDQLAMTQMLLMMTGGTLNCRAGCLEVPMPIREKRCEHQIAAKVPFYIAYNDSFDHVKFFVHSRRSILNAIFEVV